MKLKRLKIHNYCQHEGVREWEIYGNTVGIIGSNNHGKSNLVRSIQDLVTGSFHKKKQRIISWGQTEGSIEGDFEGMAGGYFRIFRSLHKNDASLKEIDTEGNVVNDVADTIAGTNEALRRYIPVDPSVLQHIVFAGQEETTTLLFGKSAARERLAQSFFGVERSGQIEAVLGEVLSSLPTYDDSIARMLDETSAEIDRLEARDSQLSEMVFDGILSNEELSQHRELVSRHAGQAQRDRRRISIAQQLESLDLAIADLQNKLKSEQESIEGFSAEEIQERIDKARQDTEVNSRIDHLERSIQSWEATAAQAEKREELQQDLENATKEQSDVVSSIGRTKAAIEAGEGVLEKLVAGEAAFCPVCEHDVPADRVDDYADKLERDRLTLKTLEERNQTLTARCTELSNSLRELHTNASMAQTRIAEARQELEPLGERREVAQIQPLLNAVNLINEGQQEVARLESEIRLKRAERMPIQRSFDEIEAEHENETITQEQCDQSTAAIQAHNQALEERTQVETERNQIRGQINSNHSQMSRLTDSYRNQQVAQRQREFVTKIRSIFHYGGAPRAVVQSRLASIQARVNHYLELLDTDYRVSAREGLDFLCRFPNKEMSSIELSGGEKVGLSVSFRLAACESFCSNVGFIVLDEPTTWLDADTKHEMVNVLDRLNELGRNGNFQALTPTHERMLLEHFDQVIEL